MREYLTEISARQRDPCHPRSVGQKPKRGALCRQWPFHRQEAQQSAGFCPMSHIHAVRPPRALPWRSLPYLDRVMTPPSARRLATGRSSCRVTWIDGGGTRAMDPVEVGNSACRLLGQTCPESPEESAPDPQRLAEIRATEARQRRRCNNFSVSLSIVETHVPITRVGDDMFLTRGLRSKLEDCRNVEPGQHMSVETFDHGTPPSCSEPACRGGASFKQVAGRSRPLEFPFV